MRLLFLPTLLFFLLSTALSAEEIYVVDLQKIISESVAGKAAKNNFEGEVKKSQQKVRLRQEELSRLQKDLEKQGSVLSEKAREDKITQLKRKQSDLELMVADERDVLRRQYDESLQKLVNEIQENVEQIARTEDIEIVVDRDKGSIFYVNPKFDITDRVIREMDKKSM